MSRLCLYFKRQPETDRFLPGDRFLRPIVRRIVRGKRRVGGVEKVFINLLLGLDRLGVSYEINLPFKELKSDDLIGVLGQGKHVLAGYEQPNQIVAGIGLMTHPSEWPTLCEQYPVVRYLQHSEWCADVYRPYFGNCVDLWPIGIDTTKWQPDAAVQKKYDFLIYNKVMWDYGETHTNLIEPILAELKLRGKSFDEIRYGFYTETEFKEKLQQCTAMIFLCEHESQGIAYQEAMATDVPILAWDQGLCLDPNRFKWGQPEIPATSVPFFDGRCGMVFKSAIDFPNKLEEFIELLHVGFFSPRDYVLDNLKLEHSAIKFLSFFGDSQ